MSRPDTIRILHVLHGLARGGIEMWLLEILQHIDRQRFAMDLLVSDTQPAELDEAFTALGANILRCPGATHPWRYGRRFQALLRYHGPYHVVHSHFDPCGFPLWWADRAGVPVRIAHSHNTGHELRSKGWLLRAALLPLTRRWIQRHATAGLAASPAAAAAMFGKEWASDPRWNVHSYGIDLAPYRADFDPVAVRSELGLPADAFVLGHVGKFAAFRQKNHEFLLDITREVAAREPRTQLLLVGEGPLRHEVQARAARMGLAETVHFLGSRPDVPRLLKAAMDAFVFPSWFEGLGLALVEAQAAGLPCVATDVIPGEATVVPQLVRRLALADGPQAWAAAVLDARHPPRPITQADALARIEQSPLNIVASVRALEDRYRQHVAGPLPGDRGEMHGDHVEVQTQP